ncbi:hypothetical protein F441_04859 [Phytophthora nicotianae CJ01A1]|uniref:Uncharacterized protein n=3 Tax=Phytophthora nicotianae TaxID=4792 RepID=W2XFE7_PHYNI|nr:hypothetical protein L915_04729 [Phytophthora nicotianae]ETP21630.1 hypothetical protein F441_04859 [Phytophthora nicotianae CJ01A1]
MTSVLPMEVLFVRVRHRVSVDGSEPQAPSAARTAGQGRNQRFNGGGGDETDPVTESPIWRAMEPSSSGENQRTVAADTGVPSAASAALHCASSGRSTLEDERVVLDESHSGLPECAIADRDGHGFENGVEVIR